MGDGFGIFLGMMIGFVTGIIFYIMVGGDNNLAWQRTAYYECLAIGAPQQRCLEKYLLPKAAP